MNEELLNIDTVVPYLISRGLLSDSADTEVEELSGGVSNVVLGIRSGSLDVVLKQALPELKVDTKWVADQRRAIVEAKAVTFFNSISPNQVPSLVDSDPDRFTLVIRRAPRTSRVWKSELLAGRINPTVGYELGKTLSAWHRVGESDLVAQQTFQESDLFEQLRVTPFYRAVQSQNPQLSGVIDELILEVTTNPSTIVHGDFSPKNFLVDRESDIYILDFEVAHFGNPVFDLAFILAHLLCKFFRTPSESEAALLKDTAARFLSGYEVEYSDSLYWHVALIALARVEGTSRVNYLDEAGQESVKRVTKSALSNPNPKNPLELFERVRP